MADKVTITAIFYEELEMRATDRLKLIGRDWKNVSMNFYFPENEDTVDLCIEAVLTSAFCSDGTDVDSDILKRVTDRISTRTKTKKAIKIVWLATFRREEDS